MTLRMTTDVPDRDRVEQRFLIVLSRWLVDLTPWGHWLCVVTELQRLESPCSESVLPDGEDLFELFVDDAIVTTLSRG